MKNISAKAIGKACGVNDMAVRISKDDTLVECFRQWKRKREEWENQIIGDEDYINWKNAFPDNLEESPHSEDSIQKDVYTEFGKENIYSSVFR